MSTYAYQIGDQVTYRNFGGQLVTVTVTARFEGGRPGFDGDTADGASLWGYDHQIRKIVHAVRS